MELTSAVHDALVRHLPAVGPTLFFGSSALAEEFSRGGGCGRRREAPGEGEFALHRGASKGREQGEFALHRGASKGREQGEFAPMVAARAEAQLHGVQLTVVDDVTKPSRLARHGPGQQVLRAHLDDLPFAERSVGAIIAIEALSRSTSPDAALSVWSRTLRDGGTLVLVERIVQSATLRTLHRLIEPSRRWLPPEQLTCLLLNAGYVRIGQFWPPARLRSVVTVGHLRVI
jgi:hypothetical protein